MRASQLKKAPVLKLSSKERAKHGGKMSTAKSGGKMGKCKGGC